LLYHNWHLSKKVKKTIATQAAFDCVKNYHALIKNIKIIFYQKIVDLNEFAADSNTKIDFYDCFMIKSFISLNNKIDGGLNNSN